MMRTKARRRGFTLLEMFISIVILGIVMSLAAFEFKAVIYGYLFDESHLSVEQQARIALQKVDEATKQATVVDPGANPEATPSPAITEPLNTPGPRLVFTAVSSLAQVPTVNGLPQLCYNDVTIFLGPVDSSQANELLENIQAHDTSNPCGNETQTPLLLARNVQDFTVTRSTPNKTAFLQGYQVDIDIFNSDDNRIDQRAGAVYHISSVITPMQFGKAN